MPVVTASWFATTRCHRGYAGNWLRAGCRRADISLASASDFDAGQPEVAGQVGAHSSILIRPVNRLPCLHLRRVAEPGDALSSPTIFSETLCLSTEAELPLQHRAFARAGSSARGSISVRVIGGDVWNAPGRRSSSVGHQSRSSNPEQSAELGVEGFGELQHGSPSTDVLSTFEALWVRPRCRSSAVASH